MRKEYDTHSRDTNNRGRTSLTTSRSGEHPAVQATFNYCDVRIKDQQAAKSNYSDLLGHFGGNSYASRDTGHRYDTNFASKVQVFKSTPPSRNPPPSTHKDRISSSATWSFQAFITPARTSDWSKAKIVATRGHLDVTEIVEFSLTQVADSERRHPSDQRSGPQWSPSQGQRDYCHDDHYQCGKKAEYKSCSYILAGAENQDWNADLDPAESSLERAHQLYQADWGGTIQTDDHTIPHDYYLGPPKPQPGSYPGGEQLTSRNTTYAELQDSLVTQEKEDLILQGRVETSMYTKTSSTEGYQKMPPPPPPKKGEPGYKAYMNRMATEEQKYCEEQARKWEE